jgi:hypothetical protein
MIGRSLLVALCACSTLGSSPLGAAAPAFVPSPRQAFEGFVAINAPRPEVPVGALWIDGFGPTGPAASADNLETVRSLNGVTMDKGLQLQLTAGLFSLLGVEPRLRDRYTARFTDLTIVRVKDISRLEGPKGEPRITEAVKAASIIVSTDGEIGLNGHTIGFQQREIEVSTSNGRTRNYAIEGRDLFIAMKVATPTLVTGTEQPLEVERRAPDEASARIGDYWITIKTALCPPPAQSAICPATYGITKLNSFPFSTPPEQINASLEAETRLPLPVPVADERGGLFDALMVRWIAPCTVRKADHCRKDPRLVARFVGLRLEDLKSPQAKGW